MKINRGLQRTTKKNLQNRINLDSPNLNKNFSDFMNDKREEYNRQILDEILEELDIQGDRLSKAMNLRELTMYKNLIKKFIDEALKGSISIEDKVGFNRFGQSKRYKFLQELDNKLVELTNLTIEKEKEKIHVLDKIGEIRGLLVNLYF